MFKNRGLAFSFTLMSCLLIAVPILALSLVFGAFYQGVLVRNAAARLTQAEINIATTLEHEIQEASLLVSTITHVNDAEIPELLTALRREQDSSERYILTQRLRSALNYTLLPRSEVASLIFFFEDGGVYQYRRSLLQSEETARNEAWYRDALEINGRVRVTGIFQNSVYDAANRYTINLALSTPNAGSSNDVELVWFAYFTDALEATRGEDVGIMLVVDGQGSVMMSDDKSLEGQNAWQLPALEQARTIENGSYETVEQGQKLLVTTYTMDSVDWKVIHYMPSNYLTRELMPTYAIFIGAILLILFFFLMFVLLFFRSILRPLDRLVEGMQCVENGDFSANIEPEGNRDLRRLTHSFNDMVRRIEELIHEVMRQEQDRMQVEIEVLQAQINPHFFANALNAIRFMAVVAKFESIQKMTEALIRIFSAAFDENIRISVAEELRIIESYVYLMQVRYNGKFEVEYAVDQDILDEQMPKMLMQPVVENAILHGFHELEHLGELRISGSRRDGALVFEVADNGHGMSEQRIASVLNKSAKPRQPGHGIGLTNTMERIRLNYASGSGVSIHSVPGKVTRVTLTLIDKSNSKDEPL